LSSAQDQNFELWQSISGSLHRLTSKECLELRG